MMIATELGAIRLAAPMPETPGLTDAERHWIALLRDLGGGGAPPPTLATVQVLRRAINVT